MQTKQETQYKTTEKLTQERIDEILRVKEKEGLTPEAIVESAKDEENPLHDLFDWNNDVAGDKWRLQQARVIINEVKVVVEEKEYFAFENVRINVEDVGPQRVYMGREEILSDEELRKQMVKKAYDALLYWRSQSENYSEFAVVHKAIDQVGELFE